jgi:Pyruvate/2-oxoacid:ferredoxin oxidoreductase gamma subunit
MKRSIIMNNSYYDASAGGGGTVINNPHMGITTLEPLSLSQPNTRAARKLVHRAETDSYQEKLKARLAGEIIVNTTSLAAMADFAAASVPSAEQPVREVVKVYALSSADRLASRW